MTIHVELDPKLESQLTAEAGARGMKVEQYAHLLLEDALAASGTTGSRSSQQEFRAFLDALASRSPNAPELLTETFSREMIYDEHD